MPLGGLGVFTKAAQKLYHWPGPATFQIEGVSPYYKPSEIPAGLMLRYITFPSPEKLTEAAMKVGESEIGFIMMGFTTGMMASNIATDNGEDMAYLKKFNAEAQGPGFMLIMAGNSPNDTEYKKQACQKIVEECSGKSILQIEDPQNAGGFMWRHIRVTGSIREVDRGYGCFAGQVGCTDNFPLMHQYILNSSPLKARLIKEDRLLDDGSNPFVQILEHGQGGHGELLLRYNPNNPEAIKATGEVKAFADQQAIEGHFGVPGHVMGKEAHDNFGPHTSNYHLWMKKIKKTFDPNAASESSHYIKAD